LAGLDVAADGRGRGRGRFAEHLVEREYINKSGKAAKRMGLTFNPFLKTKLVAVLGSSLVKQSAESSPYRAIYDAYKHRLETSPSMQAKQVQLAAEAKDKGNKYMPVGHRHAMAVRYMIKRLLADLYVEWRTLAGLAVAPEYSEAKQGLKHGSAAA
jgi:hypothetical protein